MKVHHIKKLVTNIIVVITLITLLLNALSVTVMAGTVPWIINTVAGTGAWGYSGDDGAATNANLYHPQGVAVDFGGNLFIADSDNYRIRRVDVTTGTISTIAGNGDYGYSGDGGAATSASLSWPSGIAVDSGGNIFIADHGNHRIRKVDVTTGIISTIAGNGTDGHSGDGGAATSASLCYPYGVAVDSGGNLFIADTANNRIRRLDVTTGTISTVAGNGTEGYSGDGGAATSASLSYPVGVAVDFGGNLIIADFSNHRIRRVDVTTGIISTVAGNGDYGYSGDGEAATSASLYGPHGVAVDSGGNLFIVDRNNHRIRKVESGRPEIKVEGNSQEITDDDNSPSLDDHTDFGSTVVATGTVTRTFTINNTGTYSLSLSGTPIVAISGTNAADFIVTAQPSSDTVDASGSTTFQITFDPSEASVRMAEVSISNDDADENPYNFSIQGTGTTELVTRSLPVVVSKGQTFEVTLTFAAPLDNFNSYGIYDSVPEGWVITADKNWSSPLAADVTIQDSHVEYIWLETLLAGDQVSSMYQVTVPEDVLPGSYVFQGFVEYYSADVGPFTSNITGITTIEVVDGITVSGHTHEANGSILSDVTLSINGRTPVTSTPEGIYELKALTTGTYTVTAYKDGYRNIERTVTITDITIAYSLDFRGNYGLIPNAPNMSYVLVCINKWKYPSDELGLKISKILSVINAWKYPVE